MPIPLIVPLGVAAAGGVSALTKGGYDLYQANKSKKKSISCHAAAIEKYEVARDAAASRLEN